MILARSLRAESGYDYGLTGAEVLDGLIEDGG
jgi:hypothetical protein